MDVSVMMGGSQSQVKVGIGRHDANLRDFGLGFSNFGNNDKMLSLRNRVCFSQSRNLRVSDDHVSGFTLRAAHAAGAVLPAENVSADSSSSGASSESVSPLLTNLLSQIGFLYILIVGILGSLYLRKNP